MNSNVLRDVEVIAVSFRDATEPLDPYLHPHPLQIFKWRTVAAIKKTGSYLMGLANRTVALSSESE